MYRTVKSTHYVIKFSLTGLTNKYLHHVFGGRWLEQLNCKRERDLVLVAFVTSQSVWHIIGGVGTGNASRRLSSGSESRCLTLTDEMAIL